MTFPDKVRVGASYGLDAFSERIDIIYLEE